jgi:folate-binding protein YgfZ
MTGGYRALREGAAWLDLSGRGLLRLTGGDRARLLHAMTTNHIQQMKPGDWCYAFFLNSQGRILSDAYVLCREEEFWLDVEPGRRQFVYEHLDHYIIADDVTVEDLSEEYAVIAVEGPSETAPRFAGLSAAGISVTGQPAVRLYARAGEKARVIAELEAKGIHLAAEADAEAVRLERARPRYGVDFSEAQIPHETRLLHAVHFSKGCYLGQEIVERVRSRGHVNRLLAQIFIDGAEAPAAGAKLRAGGAEAGEITSAAYSPALQRSVALGYVRAAHAKAGTELECGGRRAVVSERAPS